MLDKDAVTRRAFLAGSTAAVGFAGTSPAFADVAWKKFAGTTLEVNLAKGPRGDLLQRHAAEFTELTGIKVLSEVIPEQQQRQKAVIELTSGRPSFDVIHLSYHVQKRQFEKAGWLADLTPYLKDQNLTAPDLVEGDFSPGGLQFAKNDKGELHSLPWSVDYFILYWNKEIFQKKGVALPETLEDMASLAEKLTDPKEGIYGFVGRGLRNANMTLWTNFFLNYGGEFLDAKGNIQTDGPEAIEATKLYQRLLTKPAPPGVAGLQLDEVDGVLHARPRRDVDRRRRLGAAGRGSERVARRRQGRLRPRPERAEGPILGDLRRRHRNYAGEQEQGGRLSLLPVGSVESDGRAPPPDRRRRAVPLRRSSTTRVSAAGSRCRPNGCSQTSDRRDLGSSACR